MEEALYCPESQTRRPQCALIPMLLECQKRPITVSKETYYMY